MMAHASTQAAKRGRRATFDRDRALATALKLFWQHGYEGVSIADLTDAMGIAAPSLYHAFGSKADLYREALREYGSGGVTPAEIEAAPSSRAAVELMLSRGIEAVTTPGRPLGCMISSGLLMVGPGNASLAEEVRTLRTASRLALRRRIEADVEGGALPSGVDADGLARLAVSVLQGLSVQALDGATSAELKKVAEHVLAAWPQVAS